MTEENFLVVMKNFISVTNSSMENPSALLMDNHASHIDIDVVNLAKENGVVLLTLPPHTTNKLQPLDVGVFGPYQKAYDKAMNLWMRENPGKTVSIFEVAQFVNSAMTEAVTPKNIISGSKATGIFPFNPNIT